MVRDQYAQAITFDSRFPPNRYLRWQDTQAHLLGRLLLLKGWESLGRDRARIPALRYSDYHRPYFAEGPHFSIAHSGAYVLCAVSDQQPVGVDIERIRPIELAEMEPSFSPSDWQAILANDNPRRYLFDYWTRKEAAIKADGRGLLVVDRVELQENQARIEDTVWHLLDLPIGPGHVAYLATPEPSSAFRMIRIDY